MAERLLNILNTPKFIDAIQPNKKYYPEKNLSIYLKRGNLLLKVNGKEQQINYSSVFFINKGSVFSVRAFSEDIEICMLEASPKLNLDLVVGFSRYDAYRTLQLLEGGMQLDAKTFEITWQHIDTISQYWKKDVGEGFRERIVKSLYTALVYMIVEIIFKQKNRTTVFNDRKEAITMQFLEMVEGGFKNNRNLNHYAEQLNLTAKYISNCVRETTGASPTDFIAKTTMDFAREQLMQTPFTISEIAEQLNFSDAYSFGKFFKNHSGYSPGKFRKMLG